MRVWSALRIMTPDGFPIYDESASHPGVYVVTCHSGGDAGGGARPCPTRMASGRRAGPRAAVLQDREVRCYKRRHDDAPAVTVWFEDRPLACREGESVAAAMLAAGEIAFRSTPVSGEARGPYCLIGICFDCLIEIDGVANRQACLTEVREGMRLRRQQGPSGLEL